MAILAWLIQTVLGRAIAAAIIGGFGLWGYGAYKEHKGAQKQVAKFEQAGKVNASKSRKARKSVDSVSDANLFDKYLRD